MVETVSKPRIIKVKDLFNANGEKNVRVDAVVKPQVADELQKTKAQLFLAKNEQITKAAKDLKDLLTLKFDKNEYEIKYKGDTGEPYMQIQNYSGYSLDTIKAELDEIRELKQWLDSLGL